MTFYEHKKKQFGFFWIDFFVSNHSSCVFNPQTCNIYFFWVLVSFFIAVNILTFDMTPKLLMKYASICTTFNRTNSLLQFDHTDNVQFVCVS